MSAAIGQEARSGRVAHVGSVSAMLGLMAPMLLAGHASLAGIGATFVFFAWAAVAAVRGRARSVPASRGAVGDPFAMGLLMSVPYLARGLAGHGHGGGGAAAPTVGWAPALLALVIVAGWAVLRADSARGSRSERFGFWGCLVMMNGMIVAMSAHG